MTENEALKVLKRDLKIQKDNNALPDGIEAIEIAIQSLEEIQQYRAIGTVVEILNTFNTQQLKIASQYNELAEHRAIGTIEEFKALKEKLQGYKNQMSIYAEQHKVILASDVLDMLEELDWQ